MAKKAANKYVNQHPDVLNQKIDNTKPARLVEKKDDQSNLEIDQTESADVYSSLRADNSQNLEEIAAAGDGSVILNVEDKEDDDLSVPKWPVYSNPAAQHN
jgi:hypothetical protein